MSELKQLSVYFQSENNELVKTGSFEIEKNNFFNLLDYIMNDAPTRTFIDQYFSDWDDVKTSVMFIKTYQIVNKQLIDYEKKGKLDTDERRKMLIGLVKKLISNSESRKEIVKGMFTFMNEEYTQSENICKNMILEM